MVETPKAVFKQTLITCPWKNVTPTTGGLCEDIAKLKAADGYNIIAYGGAGFASALITHQLIDEVHLLLTPGLNWTRTPDLHREVEF